MSKCLERLADEARRLQFANGHQLFIMAAIKMAIKASALVFFFFGILSARASAFPAFTFNNPQSPAGDQLINPPFTLGWSFSVAPGASYLVKGLGVFDSGGDGLASSHDVGLWDSSQNLLASATGVMGSSLPLVDGFRYAPISIPVILPAGTYYIGATYLDGGDKNTFPGDIASLDFAPAISFAASNYNVGSTLAFPTDSGSSDYGYFGPNLDLSTVPGPLPVLGSLAFFGCSRKLRKRIKVSKKSDGSTIS